MRKFFLSTLAVLASIGCSELQNVINTIPISTSGRGISTSEITSGLKEALSVGVNSAVMNLSKKDGFLKNEAVKILLPDEFKKVDNLLRNIGLGKLADKGISLLNRAAEDAVSEAAPIFLSAIKNMTIRDARQILTGDNNAATQYLKTNTASQLNQAFQPKIKKSLGKVGADDIWKQIVTKYNAFSGKNVNSDLTAYVTEEAIDGVFDMVENKEVEIRQKIASRTTDLLRKVFALQDNK